MWDGAATTLMMWFVGMLLLSPLVAAFVLRRQLADATGATRVFKYLLHLAAVVTVPYAIACVLFAAAGLALTLYWFFEFVVRNW